MSANSKTIRKQATLSGWESNGTSQATASTMAQLTESNTLRLSSLTQNLKKLRQVALSYDMVKSRSEVYLSWRQSKRNINLITYWQMPRSINFLRNKSSNCMWWQVIRAQKQLSWWGLTRAILGGQMSQRTMRLRSSKWRFPILDLLAKSDHWSHLACNSNLIKTCFIHGTNSSILRVSYLI